MGRSRDPVGGAPLVELDALPDRKTLEALAEPWRPQRTLACRYLWRSLDNEPG